MLKERFIGAGLAVFRATGLHRHLAPWTMGQGAILTMHHVRPWVPRAFAPNRELEIAPDFLDAVLGRVRALGYDLVDLDEARRRLATRSARRFVALTIDDGYRDLLAHALPVLERHGAPFTAFITTGFVDRTARLWWVELEQAIAALPRVAVDLRGTRVALQTDTAAEKRAAFRILYKHLRAMPEGAMRDVIAALAVQAGVDVAAIPGTLCMNRDEIRALARHPLCTIGAHTVTHPMLAKHDRVVVEHEMVEGRRALEEMIGLPVRHLAYPVGDRSSAGPREFATAAASGFSTAVTTRPGLLFPAHEARPTALPRVSLNGRWQSLAMLEVLLSGAPFAVLNRGRLAA